MAMQKGCNNIINDIGIVHNTLKDITEVVEEAIDDEDHNFDEDQGDVVVYKLVAVKTAINPYKDDKAIKWENQ